MRPSRAQQIFSCQIRGIAKRLLAAAIIFVSLNGCSPKVDCSHLQAGQVCTRILFIGNSYTYVNDLPGMFGELAMAGGHAVETGMAAQGGWTLADHQISPETLALLNSSKWDYVVLQEQSQIPSVEQSRTATMYPAARSLVDSIRKTGAEPIFFLTWAHQNGWPEYGMQNYMVMQTEIDQGYLGIANEMIVPVAPVGYAWSAVNAQDPSLALWQADGSHPSGEGTYLAACVFYAVIFRDTPEGLSFHPHLSADTARLLQGVAASTVLDNPAQWNLP